MSGLRAFWSSAPSVLLGSMAARSDELRDVDAVLRQPLPLSRRIGFVHLHGGAGTSATAGYVASLLARRRRGAVLGVDASGGTGLLRCSGLTGEPFSAPSRRRRAARDASDARDGLTVSASGLHALDLRALDRSRTRDVPASPEQWFDEVGPISRFFDLVLTDWGVREVDADFGRAAAASHVLCLVARDDREHAERAAAVAEALARREGPSVTLALVDIGGTADRRSAASAGDAVPVVRIPHERSRGALGPVPSSAQSTRTRIAHLRLASTLLAQAAATTAPDAADRRRAG